MNAYRAAVLKAALDDIDNLAAPQNIDAVCDVLSVDVVAFARLGQVGMKIVVLKALEYRQTELESAHWEAQAPDALSRLVHERLQSTSNIRAAMVREVE